MAAGCWNGLNPRRCRRRRHERSARRVCAVAARRVVARRVRRPVVVVIAGAITFLLTILPAYLADSAYAVESWWADRTRPPRPLVAVLQDDWRDEVVGICHQPVADVVALDVGDRA